jgi:hypothetical protein
MAKRPAMAFATFLLLLVTCTNGFVLPHEKKNAGYIFISTSQATTTELHGIRTFVRNRFANKGRKEDTTTAASNEVGQDSKVELTYIIPEDPVEETKPFLDLAHAKEQIRAHSVIIATDGHVAQKLMSRVDGFESLKTAHDSSSCLLNWDVPSLLSLNFLLRQFFLCSSIV